MFLLLSCVLLIIISTITFLIYRFSLNLEDLFGLNLEDLFGGGISNPFFHNLNFMEGVDNTVTNPANSTTGSPITNTVEEVTGNTTTNPDANNIEGEQEAKHPEPVSTPALEDYPTKELYGEAMIEKMNNNLEIIKSHCGLMDEVFDYQEQKSQYDLSHAMARRASLQVVNETINSERQAVINSLDSSSSQDQLKIADEITEQAKSYCETYKGTAGVFSRHTENVNRMYDEEGVAKYLNAVKTVTTSKDKQVELVEEFKRNLEK